jgi:exodeoxyribonuclease-5
MKAKRQKVELTDEQNTLVQRLCQWYRKGTRQWYSYTGAAGTGKTTVIQAFIEELGLERYIACAYVGKAVTVLSRHGLPASTIHSMIYNVMWVPVYDNTGQPVIREDGRPKMTVEFSLKSSIKGDPQLIIVDEATMVNDDLADDILSFGIKTVFIGDNNQLPPVFGTSSVMLNPDFSLTKIMRQSEDDPIVMLSQRILKREFIHYGQYGKSSVRPYIELGSNYARYDIIITALNRIRDQVNDHIRHNVLQVGSALPVVGDKLICRQNDWDRSIEGNIFLTTGMTGYVTDVNRSLTNGKFMSINFQPEISEEEFYNLSLDTAYIKKGYDERKEHGFSAYEKFEYGYCVSVHQCQGSEFDKVLFIDSWFHDADLTRRMRYTAITRAKDCLDMVSEVRFVDQ